MRPGTSWCPEAGLGIPNLTSGHFRSFDGTFELLVCMGPLENTGFAWFLCALRCMCVVACFLISTLFFLFVLEGRRRVLGVQRLVYEESSLYGWVNEGEGEICSREEVSRQRVLASGDAVGPVYTVLIIYNISTGVDVS